MNFERTWERQRIALRNPKEILTCSEKAAGIEKNSLTFSADRRFVKLLDELAVTLFISREYENLLLSIHSDGRKLIQRYLPIPHPSGIACDRANHVMFVASTRNPNVICELRPASPGDPLRKSHQRLRENPMLMARKKYYPGMYYFHDLALLGGDLYGNAVGLNGVVKVDLDRSSPEELTWYPRCIENEQGQPRTDANYLQLNSIAGGESIHGTFFSASGDKVGRRRPGHLNYPVDKRGVIISGRTRETIATGLTRPHSARFHRGTIWVANSGYGEFGYIRDGGFEPIIKLNGWTRGVCIIGNIAFVGTSRVIPKYRCYAPGLAQTDDRCGLHAISLKTGAVLGSVSWPTGNQLFAIDYLSRDITRGLPFDKFAEDPVDYAQLTYNNRY